MIKVENLTKQYTAVTAVDNINFEVAEHEILGFLGPNGAGKSTTLRILTGYLSATSGKVSVDGHDVFAKPEAVKRVIGYLPENVPLYPELRVTEYLDYRAALKRVSRSKRRKAVDNAIDRCQIGDVRDRIIGQLSKGYRQRVGLADTLVGDPKILILDEPTIGLDPNQIRQVRDLINELGRERTVILSSHILPEVEAVCSRIQIIHKGKLVGQGKPEELRSRIAGKGVTIVAEVSDPDKSAEMALSEVEGVDRVSPPKPGKDGLVTYTIQAETDRAVRERIFDVAVENGFKLVGLSTESASLEDIFVQITTREEAGRDDTADEKGDDA
ncbi:MAG: ATP-binding cassette domain-containing protein [Deltaproteobacteria bacterium]|nr:ATP-binding cassette domain-containing protein [Deltaproteobacteria bacterium]